MGRYDYYYTPSVAKKVKGGIKAQSKKGAFASKWWGRRWIEMLEAFQLGARLTRGKRYARQGQVASLEITTGKVVAKVQGSRARPYQVVMTLLPISETAWRAVAQRLGEEPIYTAQLLGGEMPQGVETLFDKVGAPLFPSHRNDLETDCSCPDWSNPCKHIAAVYYLLAEVFDRDPFLLFKLRGVDRAQFLGDLHTVKDEPEDEALFAPEPLTSDPAQFWGCAAKLADPLPPLPPLTLHAAIPKRLGTLPFWRAEQELIAVMEEVYAMIGESGSNGDDQEL